MLPPKTLALFAALLASAPAADLPILEIEEVLADGKAVAFSPETGLELPAGRHDLEFHFRTTGTPPPGWLVRYHLEGHDAAWRAAGGEMEMIARLLDDAGREVAALRATVEGASVNWVAVPERAKLTRRVEPLFVPTGARTIEIEFNSGAQPDLTGEWVIDDLTVNRSGGSFDRKLDLWHNSGFSSLDKSDHAGTTPEHWQRRGDAAIARFERPGSNFLLALRDHSTTASGAWVSRQPLPAELKAGEVLSIEWFEMHRVGDSGGRVVRYDDVPPGRMRFQAIGCGSGGAWLGAGASLPVVIRPFVWSRPWFWPAIALLGAALLGIGVWQAARRRYRRKIERLEMQAALEKDRMRIARDIHDDVGAQLTRLTLLCAGLDREAADPRVGEISTTARQLVHSMDEIVWAVDPGNDTLDHLGTYLCRFAGEFFEDSGVRARYDVPALLPAVPLSAEVRHNLFLAVKEALNNVLKHAAAREVRLALTATPTALEVSIGDDGAGFAPDDAPGGHGLRNMRRRLEEIGGSCRIESAPGTGTRVTFHWPLPSAP